MGSFHNTLVDFGEKTDVNLQKIRKDIQKKIVSDVINATPAVAKSNWQGSKNATRSVIMSEDLSGSTTISKAAGKIFGEDGTYYFCNNFPYICHMEYGLYEPGTENTTADGYSVEAPGGMVRKSMSRITALIRSKYG